MDWRPISDFPLDKALRCSLIIQNADGSDQRILPDVFFIADLGGTAVERDGSQYHLSENGEYATHFGEVIEMPAPEPSLS